MIDSIRWEVFAESLQDYAILANGRHQARTIAMLADIKAYCDFPKNEDWIKQRWKRCCAARSRRRPRQVNLQTGSEGMKSRRCPWLAFPVVLVLFAALLARRCRRPAGA
jgi:hypothetical protein